MNELKRPFIGSKHFLHLLVLLWGRISAGLKMSPACFPEALKEYLKCNNCLPSRIIVYRDGVGDGQLLSVVDFEVAQIKDSIRTLGEDYM